MMWKLNSRRVRFGIRALLAVAVLAVVSLGALVAQDGIVIQVAIPNGGTLTLLGLNLTGGDKKDCAGIRPTVILGTGTPPYGLTAPAATYTPTVVTVPLGNFSSPGTYAGVLVTCDGSKDERTPFVVTLPGSFSILIP